jgi:Ran GTPase-activating protein (RanGAP) involved in mRNA processing and transport
MYGNTNQDQLSKYVKIFGDGVKNDLTFFQLCKLAMNSKYIQTNESDPKIKFYMECIKDNAVALPIMTKIIDGQLLIRNTKLNSGLANALKGMLLLNKTLINKLYLDSNGLDGENLTQILQGIAVQNPMKVLIIQDNMVNEECVEQIAPLFKNRMPNNLEELHILHCKVQFRATEDLL